MEKGTQFRIKSCSGLREYLWLDGGLVRLSDCQHLPRHLRLRLMNQYEKGSSASTERRRATAAGNAGDWR
jgi:hypothetical protein